MQSARQRTAATKHEQCTHGSANWARLHVRTEQTYPPPTSYLPLPPTGWLPPPPPPNLPLPTTGWLPPPPPPPSPPNWLAAPPPPPNWLAAPPTSLSPQLAGCPPPPPPNWLAEKMQQNGCQSQNGKFHKWLTNISICYIVITNINIRQYKYIQV